MIWVKHGECVKQRLLSKTAEVLANRDAELLPKLLNFSSHDMASHYTTDNSTKARYLGTLVSVRWYETLFFYILQFLHLYKHLTLNKSPLDMS